MTSIIVNGERCTISQQITIADLLRERHLDRAPCAVEVNRRVIPRRQHAEHRLNANDVVEIVTLVGGG